MFCLLVSLYTTSVPAVVEARRRCQIPWTVVTESPGGNLSDCSSQAILYLLCSDEHLPQPPEYVVVKVSQLNLTCALKNV